jgi:hypothetical protein
MRPEFLFIAAGRRAVGVVTELLTLAVMMAVIWR